MEKKYNVFISYRRDGGEVTAKMIHDKLHDLGYQVFLDVESLRSGLFNIKLYSVIDECTDVVVILSPGALDRCENENDWVRREIEYALQKEKNVIPIMLRGFDFPENLPKSIETLPYMQGLKANLEYFDAFMQRLQSFLMSEPYHPDPVLPRKRLTTFFPVALTALVVTIGIVLLLSNNIHKNPAPSPSPEPDSSESSQTEIPDTSNSSENQASELGRIDDDIRWRSNTLMLEVTQDVNEDTGVLGSDIARNEILSITFLDSLDDMPENAWDVSEKLNKKVMAWTVPRDGGYDLYIGGKGGVAANEDSSHLFDAYINVERIQINGNFHTDNVKNMYAMFYNCISLGELDISEFNTSNVVNMSYMFSWCLCLRNLDVSKFDTSRVENMCSMFDECVSLTELDVSGFDTSRVTNMRAMFYDCQSLTQLDVSRFDTSRVTNMQAMFCRCKGLTQLDVNWFDTSQVEDMRSMFYECQNLTQLDVSRFDTSNVTTMYAMFYACESLTQLDVSNFDTSNVTNMSYMFERCSNLNRLDVKDFDTSNVTEAIYMFLDCDNLTEPDVSNFAPELLENLGLSM